MDLAPQINSWNNIFEDIENEEGNQYEMYGLNAKNMVMVNCSTFAGNNPSSSDVIENCILIAGDRKDELTNYSLYGNYRNCIFDFEFPPEVNIHFFDDLGGNVILDSTEIEDLFVDYENGDYHLREGSVAVDAGYNSDFFPFGFGNSLRLWDGDGDGETTIDIGPYEYGAPVQGKIMGHISETETGEPVKYVLVRTTNDPGQFAVSDSLGNFELQLPEGIYDLTAERIFHEDSEVFNISVNNDEITNLEFNMTDTLVIDFVDNEDDIVENQSYNLVNYPNPFKPVGSGRSIGTTISFSLPRSSRTELAVYNIKGQKVKTLVNENLSQGEHNIVWNGKNNKQQNVASGVYMYRLNVDGMDVKINKCLVVK
jgi:hypothetical protein